MTPAARLQAAIELVELIADAARDNGPAADTIIAGWFRTRRYAGSKDRRAVRDLVYRAIRGHSEIPASGRLAFAAFGDLVPLFDGSVHGPAELHADEHGFAPTLVPKWLETFIPEAERESLLGRATFDLRVNPTRGTRDAAVALIDGAVPIAGTEFGIRLPENIPLAQRPELEGLVEVQDAGSQLITQACAAKPGETVVDLCAGAGGKTLALAADMQGEGRLIATDTDRGRLDRLLPRAAKAGAEGIETRLLNPTKELSALDDLLGAADCVLVDAPCSGTGTWRRNPELRWRLTPKRLDQVIALQQHVLEIAVELVKPGGRLVYAVCSLIDREGRQQAEAFLALHPDFKAVPADTGRVHGPGRMLTPFRDETDGFFFAVLARNG